MIWAASGCVCVWCAGKETTQGELLGCGYYVRACVRGTEGKAGMGEKEASE